VQDARAERRRRERESFTAKKSCKSKINLKREIMSLY